MKHYFIEHPFDPSAPEISFDGWCDMEEEEAEEYFEERLLNDKNNDVNHENIQ